MYYKNSKLNNIELLKEKFEQYRYSFYSQKNLISTPNKINIDIKFLNNYKRTKSKNHIKILKDINQILNDYILLKKQIDNKIITNLNNYDIYFNKKKLKIKTLEKIVIFNKDSFEIFYKLNIIRFKNLNKFTSSYKLLSHRKENTLFKILENEQEELFKFIFIKNKLKIPNQFILNTYELKIKRNEFKEYKNIINLGNYFY